MCCTDQSKLTLRFSKSFVSSSYSAFAIYLTTNPQSIQLSVVSPVCTVQCRESKLLWVTELSQLTDLLCLDIYPYKGRS